ncbi:hypothetical protein ABXT08_19905 [Chryseobacterium sp. NRRL B-14859]|uniref:hypothetical protein n=1 Tax=Chryseobacterium sp. NRRL B-14859 TaxID=1562763 RepID=UPI00339ADEFA
MRLLILIFIFLFSCKENKATTNNSNKSTSYDSISKVSQVKTIEDISGQWKYSKKSPGEKVSEEMFTLKIIQSGDHIKAQYCAIANSGGKIDCENEEIFNVQGVIRNGKVFVDFYSFSSSSKDKGKAEIIINKDHTLQWIVTKAPKGEFYAPDNAVMIRTLEEKTTNTNNLINEKRPIKVSLPFSFYQYFKDEYSEVKYPSYNASSSLIDFLKSKNYDGETYKSFVIHSDDHFQYLVASMSRGDSEYFILITVKNNTITDYKEIGAIGDENPITFKISPDFIIEKYKGNTLDVPAFEKFKIDKNGKIIKL